MPRRPTRPLVWNGWGVLLLLLLCPWQLVEARPNLVPAQQSEPQCDPQVYHGVQHCKDNNGETHLLLVDLTNPNVRVQMALSVGPRGECNLVDHVVKDPTSNCPKPYPFERIPDMLERYKPLGAVAVINTDYFGSSDGDHGAQGLAVRNGVRLDGGSSDTDNNETKTSWLAISQSKQLLISKLSDEAQINIQGTHYNVVSGGPTIVRDGQALDNSACLEEGFLIGVCNSLAQSAGAIAGDGRLVLMTAKKHAADMALYLTSTFQARSALKFDGGGSARIAWLDERGNIQTHDPTIENRRVAQGLVIFSTRITSSGPRPDSAVRLISISDIPVLQPGETAPIEVLIQNASALEWPASSVTLVSVNDQTLRVPSPQRMLRSLPAAAQGRWTLMVTAPDQPGVYDSVWRMTYDDTPFGEEITISVVVLPQGSSAGFGEAIRAMIEAARQDLNQRFEETWEDLKRRIMERIQEEIERELRSRFAACATAPASLLLSIGLALVRYRKRWRGYERIKS